MTHSQVSTLVPICLIAVACASEVPSDPGPMRDSGVDQRAADVVPDVGDVVHEPDLPMADAELTDVDEDPRDADVRVSDSGGDDARSEPDVRSDPDIEVGTDTNVDPDIPCHQGTELTVVEPVPIRARFGAVFAESLYDPNNPSLYQPRPVVVQLTRAAVPVAGCGLDWNPAPTGSSFVFPWSDATDVNGEVSAWWVAADVPEPSLLVRVPLGPQTTIQGHATPSAQTRTNSMHLNYRISSEYDEFRVRVEPLNGPPKTYYSTINWPGAYTGIQFVGSSTDAVSCGAHTAPECAACPDGHGAAWCNGDCHWVDSACIPRPAFELDITKVLFSVWDVDGFDSEIIDVGDTNQQVGFGGEGTGTSARLALPPARFGAIAGLPDDYTLQVGHVYETLLTTTLPGDCSTCIDYTVTFRDLTRGLGPISLGTQRYHRRDRLTYASSFVEDWLDAPGDHCVNSGVRSAYFRDVAHRRDGGAWIAVTEARVHANYVPDNNEVCANYGYGGDADGFLLSSGGAVRVDAPLIEGDADVSLPQ